MIARHPDDETIGFGGLIRSCVEAGVPVRIFVLSDGAGSHPNSCRYPKPALTVSRHGESIAAAALVDAARVRLPSIIVYAYAIWGWTLPSDWDVGAPPSGFRLDFTRHRPAKRVAVAEHCSQITALVDDDPDGFRLQPAMLERFAQPFEAFILIAP